MNSSSGMVDSTAVSSRVFEEVATSRLYADGCFNGRRPSQAFCVEWELFPEQRTAESSSRAEHRAYGRALAHAHEDRPVPDSRKNGSQRLAEMNPQYARNLGVRSD